MIVFEETNTFFFHYMAVHDFYTSQAIPWWDHKEMHQHEQVSLAALLKLEVSLSDIRLHSHGIKTIHVFPLCHFHILTIISERTEIHTNILFQGIMI